MQTKKHIKKKKVVKWCKNVTPRSHHLYGAENCGHCCAIVVPLTTKPHFPVVILIDRSTVLSSLTSFTATRKLWSVIQAIHFLILHCDVKTLAHPVVAYKWYIVWWCKVEDAGVSNRIYTTVHRGKGEGGRRWVSVHDRRQHSVVGYWWSLPQCNGAGDTTDGQLKLD